MCTTLQSEQEAGRSRHCHRAETAMKKLLKAGAGAGLALLSHAVLATQEDVVATVVNKGPICVFILFIVIVILGVYSTKSRDK